MTRPGSPGDWLKLLLLLAVPLELFVIGYVTAPDPAPDPMRSLQAGPVALRYDGSWSPRGSGTLVHPDGSRLRIVPAAAAGLADDDPRAIDAGGAPGLAYRAGAGAEAYVFTLRDGARVAVTCQDAGSVHVCGPLLSTVRVDGAVDPLPSPAVATALRDVLAAVASRGVARSYRALADTAARLAGEQPSGAGRPLTRVARAARAVLADLQALAGTRRRTRYRTLRRQLARHGHALDRTLRALEAQGYTVEAPRA